VPIIGDFDLISFVAGIGGMCQTVGTVKQQSWNAATQHWFHQLNDRPPAVEPAV